MNNLCVKLISAFWLLSDFKLYRKKSGKKHHIVIGEKVKHEEKLDLTGKFSKRRCFTELLLHDMVQIVTDGRRVKNGKVAS